jgi:hypothetical protein
MINFLFIKIHRLHRRRMMNVMLIIQLEALVNQEYILFLHQLWLCQKYEVLLIQVMNRMKKIWRRNNEEGLMYFLFKKGQYRWTLKNLFFVFDFFQILRLLLFRQNLHVQYPVKQKIQSKHVMYKYIFNGLFIFC